jgi:predicted permease
LLIARLLRFDAPATRGLLLVVMFVNGGNYGLGVVERAFGEAALSRAIVYFTTSTLLVYTVGVAIAAGGDGRGLRGVARNVFGVPPVYAALAALLLRGIGVDPARSALEPLAAGIDVLAGASIPCMLIILGIQLSRTSVASDLRTALIASAARLVLGALVALGAASVLGLSGAAQQAAIVEASMPSAVITIILATEYHAAPALVTSTVLLSTLLSPLTLIPILSLLK